MFFIPHGTVVKDVESFQQFATRKNVFVEARMTILNGEPEFVVDVKSSGYMKDSFRSYSVETEEVPGGYKVKKVWNVT
jgi:hypothetical protein